MGKLANVPQFVSRYRPARGANGLFASKQPHNGVFVPSPFYPDPVFSIPVLRRASRCNSSQHRPITDCPTNYIPIHATAGHVLDQPHASPVPLRQEVRWVKGRSLGCFGCLRPQVDQLEVKRGVLVPTLAVGRQDAQLEGFIATSTFSHKCMYL